MIGWVTQLAPLQVRPQGAKTGQPAVALDHVDTGTFVADTTKVIVQLEGDDRLYITGVIP